MKTQYIPYVIGGALLGLLLLPSATLDAASNQILGWNNLGMHCMDSDYSVFSVLPPYNTIEAQLIVGGLLMTNGSGYTVTYQAVADPDGSFNSTSAHKGNYYDFASQLYGPVGVDMGLAGWAMPGTNNIPQFMLFENTNHPAAGVSTPVNWFRAEGIPITPYDDAGRKNPYPLMRLIAWNPSSQPIATNDVILPVSDEMDCRACHASGSGPAAQPAAGWVTETNAERNYRLNILLLHDERQFALHHDVYVSALAARGFNPAGLYQGVVADGKPVLCAICHASEALGLGSYSNIPPLTASVHSHHATVMDPTLNMTLDNVANRAACYRCHPGSTTKCLRGAMGAAVAADGSMEMQCQSCHGNMSAVGSPNRVGWFMEPACQSCHTGPATHNNGQIRYTSVFEAGGAVRSAVDQTFATRPNIPAPGISLYRFSIGHGGLQCSACHGSTHAEFPSSHRNDNLRNIALQGHAGVMAECTACHTTMPSTINGGPHGMHPLGQTWVSQHHDIASANLAQCQGCHGLDFRGTVLSRAQGDRVLTVGDDGGGATLNLFRGAEIGCYTCHNGPGGGDVTLGGAPTVRNVSANTAVDQSVTMVLPATGVNLTLRIISQPGHGSVGLNGSVATYFPDPGFVGIDNFKFAAYDGAKNSNPGTGTIGVGVALDTSPPTIQITSPTSSLFYQTANATLTLSGTASDNTGVTSVTWSNSRGGAGTANGTTNWTVSGIGLQSGVNVITVTAYDDANNTGIATLTVTYSTAGSVTVSINGIGTVSPNLNGQGLHLGSTYTLAAIPGAGYVFSNWTGSIVAGTPRLTFTLQSNLTLQANFVPNPFIPLKGVFGGLFAETGGVARSSSGAFTIKTTTAGAFSGQLQMGASHYPFKGAFDVSGRTTLAVARPGLNPLSLTMALDVANGTDRIIGTVSDGTWTAQLAGDRAVFNGLLNAAPQSGRYTLVIPGDLSSLMRPGGDGYGMVSVNAAGNIKVRGVLADGTRFSRSAVVSKYGQWPLYVPLYGGQGSLWSWIAFTNAPADDMVGDLTWIKPSLPAAQYYPAGFTVTATAPGSSYHPPSGGKALNITNGQVALHLGAGALNVTNNIALGMNTQVTNLSSNQLTLTINLSTGIFKGTVVNPGTALSIPFGGVLLQKRNVGSGFFLGAGQSGQVYFGP